MRVVQKEDLERVELSELLSFRALVRDLYTTIRRKYFGFDARHRRDWLRVEAGERAGPDGESVYLFRIWNYSGDRRLIELPSATLSADGREQAGRFAGIIERRRRLRQPDALREECFLEGLRGKFLQAESEDAEQRSASDAQMPLLVAGFRSALAANQFEDLRIFGEAILTQLDSQLDRPASARLAAAVRLRLALVRFEEGEISRKGIAGSIAEVADLLSAAQTPERH